MHNGTLVPIQQKIISVNIDFVNGLLNRKLKTTYCSVNSKLKIYKNPYFRSIIVTKTMNTRLLQYQLGIHKAYKYLSIQEKIILEKIKKHETLEIESEQEGFIATFTSS